MPEKEDKDGEKAQATAEVAAKAVASPAKKEASSPPARFEVRTPLERFSGTRGTTSARNTKTGKLELHEGVRIKSGVGFTDDALVARECARIGYKVTDHKNEGK